MFFLSKNGLTNSGNKLEGTSFCIYKVRRLKEIPVIIAVINQP